MTVGYFSLELFIAVWPVLVLAIGLLITARLLK